MCLAVPGKIIDIAEGGRATVDMLGVTHEASLRLVPAAQVGDYVLVHAGFGIQVISAEEAAETIQIFRDLGELAEEGGVEGAPGAADVTAAAGALA